MIVVPLHHYFRPDHLEQVVEQMRTLGPPRIRGYFDQEVGVWYAFEGTHRLRAAKILGPTPVLVPSRWVKGRKALARARFAVAMRGHVFDVAS